MQTSSPFRPAMSTQPDDPPVTRESVRRAIEAANEERMRVSVATGMPIALHPMPEFHPMPSAEDDIRLEEHEIIRRVSVYVGGWQRLATLVRNLAHYDGQEV